MSSANKSENDTFHDLRRNAGDVIVWLAALPLPFMTTGQSSSSPKQFFSLAVEM